MNKSNVHCDSIAVFDNPIPLMGHEVFGVLYNSYEPEQTIIEYIRYLMGASQWVSNGNLISHDKEYWLTISSQDGEECVEVSHLKSQYVKDYYYNASKGRVVTLLTSAEDNPICYTDKEVDDDCFILDKSLIDRFESSIQEKGINITNKTVTL